MKISTTPLDGVLVIEPRVFGDERGCFFESWNDDKARSLGLNLVFRQDNVSVSQRGVLRGLHFQNPRPQGKLVQVLQGEVFDVAVDLRADSPTFRKWHAEILCSKTRKQLYIPPGFAHGFLALSTEDTLLQYKCTDVWCPEGDSSLAWNDPDIAIDWPLGNTSPLLSAKDAQAPKLCNLDPTKLFHQKIMASNGMLLG